MRLPTKFYKEYLDYRGEVIHIIDEVKARKKWRELFTYIDMKDKIKVILINKKKAIFMI
jgi:hypothetical protein